MTCLISDDPFRQREAPGRLPWRFCRQFPQSAFLIPALRADALFIQGDAAQRAAVDVVLGLKFRGGRVDAAGKGELGDVQLVLQQVVHDLDHAFHRHGLLGHHQTALGIGGGKLRLECGAPHLVGRRAVLDPLLFVNVKDGGQERVVLSQNEGMVKVLQNLLGGLLDLIAGKDHVHAGLDGILDLNGQDAGVAVEILGLTLEAVKSVRVLQIQCRNASHLKILLLYLFADALTRPYVDCYMLCLFRLLSLRRPAFWAEIVHLQVVEQKVLAQLAAQGRGQVFIGNIHDFPAMPADQMVMLMRRIVPVRHPLDGDLADQTGFPQLVQIVVYR